MTILSDANREVFIFQPMHDLPAPLESVGIIGWLRENLFSSKVNSLLTMAALLFLWKTVPEPDSDIYDDHWVLLLDDNGLPTALYYQLLR